MRVRDREGILCYIPETANRPDVYTYHIACLEPLTTWIATDRAGKVLLPSTRAIAWLRVLEGQVKLLSQPAAKDRHCVGG